MSNCINDKIAEEKGYYFNSTYNQYVKCDKACINCISGLIGNNTNCIKCNEEKGYYGIKGIFPKMCFNEENIKEGYFLNKNEETFVWEECYENCASCKFKGNSQNMGCISCKNNLFLTKESNCLPSCLNGTYEYLQNFTCLDICPEHYKLNKEKTRCIYSETPDAITVEEFKEKIFENISSFINSSTVINGSTFIAQVIAASEVDPIKQIQNGISGLYLDDCIKILKEVYNISENEDLIVIEIETREDKEKNKNLDKKKDCIDLGKNVKLSISDFNGNILDLSFCKSPITIIKYVGDKEDIDVNTAKEFAMQGIDVFNAQHDFFNDKCYNFKNDKDIILKDRRNDMFQNVTFCGDDCVYNGMDYSLMIAKCSCIPENIQETSENIETEHKDKKGITLNDLTNSFKSEIYSINFDVIKCYNLVFDINILKKNKGFFTNLILFLLQILFLIYFFIKRFKPIRNYLLVFEPFDPRIDPPNPPKVNENLNKSEDNITIKKKNSKEKKLQKNKFFKYLLKENELSESNSDSNSEYNEQNKDKLIKNNFMNIQILNRNNNNKIEDINIIKTLTIESNEYSQKNINSNEIKNMSIAINSAIKQENYKNIAINNDIEKNNNKNLIQNKNRKPLKYFLRNKNKIKITNNNKNERKLTLLVSTEEFLLDENIKMKKKRNNRKNNSVIYHNKNNIEENLKQKEENSEEQGNMKLKYKKVNYAHTIEELIDMDFVEALKNDKRTFFKMYASYILLEHIIFNTFCTDIYLELKPIKLSFLVFGYQINFFLNALFYTDEYISDTYHNDGIFDFVSSLPKSIYSFIVTLVIMGLLKMLSNSKKQLNKIIKEREDKNEYLKAIEKELQKLKKKIIFYFIIIFILGIFFVYYVSAFCSVYQNSQTFWLYGCLESSVLDFITPFLICLILSIFRYTGLKQKNKCLYNFANCLGILV